MQPQLETAFEIENPIAGLGWLAGTKPRLLF
jgi:hypothetical protein